MSDKVNIEELFRQKLEGFEVDVPKSAWNVVKSNSNFGQSTISTGNIAASTGSTSSFAAGIIGGLAVSALTLVSPGIIQKQLLNTNNTVSQIQLSQKNNHLTVEAKSDRIQTELESDNQHSINTVKGTIQPIEEHSESTSESSIQINSLQEVSEESYTALEATKPAVKKVVPVSESTVEETVNASFKSSIKASPVGGKTPLEVQFNAPQGVVKSVWDFGDGTKKVESLSASHEYEESGSYTVTMIAQKEDGSYFMDQISVRADEPKLNDQLAEETQELSLVEVPNIFTPNGDGANDVFKIEANNLTEFEIRIYNPGGALVYTSNDPDFNWNGTDRSGAQIPEGTYFYQIKAVGSDLQIHALKGSLTVLR